MIARPRRMLGLTFVVTAISLTVGGVSMVVGEGYGPARRCTCVGAGGGFNTTVLGTLTHLEQGDVQIVVDAYIGPSLDFEVGETVGGTLRLEPPCRSGTASHDEEALAAGDAVPVLYRRGEARRTEALPTGRGYVIPWGDEVNLGSLPCSDEPFVLSAGQLPEVFASSDACLEFHQPEVDALDFPACQQPPPQRRSTTAPSPAPPAAPRPGHRA